MKRQQQNEPPQTPAPLTAKSDYRINTMPSRLRGKDSQLEGHAKPRPKPVDVKTTTKRSLLPKSPESQVKPLSRSRINVVERKELEEKLLLSENLVKDLQSEVLCLKQELDKAESLRNEMEKQNRKLVEDLVAAEAKIDNLSSQRQVRDDDNFFLICSRCYLVLRRC